MKQKPQGSIRTRPQKKRDGSSGTLCISDSLNYISPDIGHTLKLLIKCVSLPIVTLLLEPLKNK